MWQNLFFLFGLFLIPKKTWHDKKKKKHSPTPPLFFGCQTMLLIITTSSQEKVSSSVFGSLPFHRWSLAPWWGRAAAGWSRPLCGFPRSEPRSMLRPHCTHCSTQTERSTPYHKCVFTLWEDIELKRKMAGCVVQESICTSASFSLSSRYLKPLTGAIMETLFLPV